VSTNMATITKTNKIPSRGQNKLFYHLPPTAVPISSRDVGQAIQALINPADSLQEFLSALSDSIGNPNCFLTSSGRSALTIILLTLKRRSKRSKVILPAYSCPTVPQAVLAAGLQPVFCDVSINRLDLDRSALMKLLDADVLAIIPTYLYGLVQDISDLVEIGQELGIAIIEDAAQALGATIEGRLAGSVGDIGFFSFGRGKCIPTGHGGAIVADDRFVPELIQTIKESIPDGVRRDFVSLIRFLAYGLATTPFGWWFIVRSPFNPARDGMDPNTLPPISQGGYSPTQAGIGLSMLERMDSINNVRRRNAHRLMDSLSEHEFVHIPNLPDRSEPVFLRLPIILDEKSYADRLYQLLSDKGIGVSKSYLRTLPEIFSSYTAASPQSFPGADHLADCLLTLPTHAYLHGDDFVKIQYIFQSMDT
jgi:perosamine synthetase